MPNCPDCALFYADSLRRCPHCGTATEVIRQRSLTMPDVGDEPTGGNRSRRGVVLVLLLAIGAGGLYFTVGIPGAAEPVPIATPAAVRPKTSPVVVHQPHVRQEGIQPGSVEGALTVDEAVLYGHRILLKGTIAANAVVRVTVDGAPIPILPSGDRFQALLERDKTSVELVAEGIDGKTSRQLVLVEAPRPDPRTRFQLQRHLDGHTFHGRDIVLELALGMGEPTLGMTLDRVETFLRVGDEIVRLYHAPEGWTFLRLTRTGQYAFLRERDEQEVILIPAGIARRGFGKEPPHGPRHIVRLSPYLMDRTEVSCDQYARFLAYMTQVGDPSLRHQDDRDSDLRPMGWESDKPPAGVGPLPVTGISWYAAHAYCRWVGGRLPTEAEWERAGAGAQGFHFPWGDDFQALRCRTEANSPVAARSLLASASVYGVLHSSGNVREWCHDRYGPRWYRYDSRIDPRGPTSNGHRVVRGGSYASATNSLVLQTREHASPDRKLKDLGFRVAKSWPDSIH